MEALILAIVIGIISSLFKDKGQKQQSKKPTKQMPPFSSQPAPRTQQTTPNTKQQNRPRTLEDFANEVFGQLNEKAKPVVQQVEQVAEVASQVEVPVARVSERPKMAESTRTLTERPLVEKLKKQQAQGLQVVPRNNEELMQAIVMAEVLGPPKARRK